MTNLSLGACVGTMKAIAKGAVTHEIDALGITEGDYKLVTSPSQWVATDRTRVRGVLDALAYGTCDLMGVPRFPLPAEYIAAVLTVFVSPMNVMVACRWMERHEVATTMAIGSGTEPEMAEAPQIFALCQMMYDDVHTQQARAQFAHATGRAIAWTESNGEVGQAD